MRVMESKFPKIKSPQKNSNRGAPAVLPLLNNEQGIVFQNCKFYYPLGRDCALCGHIVNIMKMLNFMKIFYYFWA